MLIFDQYHCSGWRLCSCKRNPALNGESTLSSQLFFLRLRPIQFLSSKHPPLSPLVRKLERFLFFSLLLPRICDVSPICGAAEMESIERKWPGEQPWWFSVAASDQLTAFRRKLSRCKKLKQHFTKPQGQTAFDFEHSSLTFLPSWLQCRLDSGFCVNSSRWLYRSVSQSSNFAAELYESHACLPKPRWKQIPKLAAQYLKH